MSLFGLMGSVGAVAHGALMDAHHAKRVQAAGAARTRRQVVAVRGLANDLEAARAAVVRERRRAEAAEELASDLAQRVLQLENALGIHR